MTSQRNTYMLAVGALLLCQALSVFADTQKNTSDSIRRRISEMINKSAVMMADPGCRAIQNKDFEKFKQAVPNLNVVNIVNTSGVSYIHMVSILGLEDFATHLLDIGVDINSRDDQFKSTPFITALLAGQEHMAQWLLARGADPHETYKGATAIHMAARMGSTELLDSLVGHGLDLNATTGQQLTPLIIAASMGNVDLVSRLLSHGADPSIGDRYAQTPLHWSARNNHVETLFELMDWGGEIDSVNSLGMTPLMLASANGAREAANALIEQGAMVNIVTPANCSAISYAVSKGDFEIADLLVEHDADLGVKDQYGQSLLHLARYKDNPDMIRRLLELNADLDACDASNYTTIHRAVIENKTNTFKLLMDAGADLSIPDKSGFTVLMSCAQDNRKAMMVDVINKEVDINRRGKKGQSALMIASYYADTQTVAMLLSAGAHINARAAQDQHSLNYAYWSTNLATFTYLLENGANPNLKSKYRLPIMFDVINNERVDFLLALINNKADVNITDIEGHTPLFNAARVGNEEMAQMLIDAGVHISKRGLSGLTAWHVANDSDHPDVASLLSAHMTDKQRSPTNRVRVFFDLDAPLATNVFVSGTFNGWRENVHRLTRRDDDGWWYTEIDIYPGFHGYKFVVDHSWIVDPLNPDIRIGTIFSSQNSIFYAKNKLVENRPKRTPSNASNLLPVTFTYHSRTARTVSVVGEFNGWNTETMPMRLGKVGVWSLSTRLAAGNYGYKFFVDGNWIMDPSNRMTIVVGKNVNSLIEVKAVPTE